MCQKVTIVVLFWITEFTSSFGHNPLTIIPSFSGYVITEPLDNNPYSRILSIARSWCGISLLMQLHLARVYQASPGKLPRPNGRLGGHKPNACVRFSPARRMTPGALLFACFILAYSLPSLGPKISTGSDWDDRYKRLEYLFCGPR
jgi:hypothetical protein